MRTNKGAAPGGGYSLAQRDKQVSWRLVSSTLGWIALLVASALLAAAMPHWETRHPSRTFINSNRVSFETDTQGAVNIMSGLWAGDGWSPSFLRQGPREYDAYVILHGDGKAEAIGERAAALALLAAHPQATGYAVHVQRLAQGRGKILPMAVDVYGTFNVHRLVAGEKEKLPYFSSGTALATGVQPAFGEALIAFWKSAAKRPPKEIREWAATQTQYSWKGFGKEWWVWATLMNALFIVMLCGAAVLLVMMLWYCYVMLRIGSGWKRLIDFSCSRCRYPIRWLRPEADGKLRCPECGEEVGNAQQQMVQTVQVANTQIS